MGKWDWEGNRDGTVLPMRGRKEQGQSVGEKKAIGSEVEEINEM